MKILLTGAALIREREHGTIEHLLVMPLTPAEIMIAKHRNGPTGSVALFFKKELAQFLEAEVRTKEVDIY